MCIEGCAKKEWGREELSQVVEVALLREHVGKVALLDHRPIIPGPIFMKDDPGDAIPEIDASPM